MEFRQQQWKFGSLSIHMLISNDWWDTRMHVKLLIAMQREHSTENFADWH